MDKWTLTPNDWHVSFNDALKKGLIKKADTLEGLADALGLNATKLKRTVETWNGYCKDGKDPDFGVTGAFLVPVVAPPFYGAEEGGQLECTNCGLRVNSQMQVLDKKGNSIPGLYAAFHTAGGATGEDMMGPESVLSHCNLAMTSGYIASDAAASEKV